MQDLDRSASEDYKIPSIVLMENAGLGTVLMAERELGSCKNTFSPIFVGPGNNGGDGLVIGRHLHQRGGHPVFFFLVNPEKLTGDAKKNLEIIKKLRLPFHIIDNVSRAETIPVLIKQFESRGLPCYAIFDAIFGIGLCRDVTDHFAETIRLINTPTLKGNSPVISIDTPSGMESDTGEVLGACVRADYTATYCCAKPGHFIHGSPSWTGKLEIIDIGIPPEALYNASISTELATEDTIQRLSYSLRRKKASHKGSHGHMLIIGGSVGKTGAAILAAKGALRAGAGLVTMAAPEKINPIYETALPEAMSFALPESKDILNENAWPLIEEHLQNKQAIVVGPGVGTDESTAKLILQIYKDAECPAVFDADALNILSQYSGDIPKPAGPRIYTPHPGELSRLLQTSIKAIEHDRLGAAKAACKRLNAQDQPTVVVLKGAGTITANSSGSLFINTTGNPGMATGGMGDVLSGIIGALICQGLSPMDAAVAGVYLHGAAADLLHDQVGVGFNASEVADMLPFARQKLISSMV